MLSQSIKDPQEQVEVAWIRLDPESGISAEEVRDRLELQDFATVAKDVGTPLVFADANGYVGWVPRQAFPDLDDLLYGDEEKGKEPLAVGGISDPDIHSRTVFTSSASCRAQRNIELTETMRNKLNDELVLDLAEAAEEAGGRGGLVEDELQQQVVRMGRRSSQYQRTQPTSRPRG